MHTILFYLTGLLNKKERKILSFITLLFLFCPVIDLFSISMTVPILNKAVSESVSSRLIVEIAFFGGIFLFKGAYDLIRNKIGNHFQMNTAHSWSVKIYDLYSKEDLLHHSQKSAIQAITDIKSDAQICAEMIITFLNLFIYLLTLIGYFLVIVYVTKWIGLISCILIALLMLLLLFFSRIYIEDFGNKKRQIEIKLNSLISTAFGSYKEIKIDSRRENMLKKYCSSSIQFSQIQKNYLFVSTIVSNVLQNIMQAMLFFLLAVLLAAGISLSDIFAEIVIYITLLIRMMTASNSVVSSLNSIYFGKKHYNIFHDNMERYKILMTEEERNANIRKKNISHINHIRMEDLTFSYPNGNKIFDHASIEIASGQSTAVIGISGSGKTTFLDLLLGLLSPQSGHVWYGDYDVVEGKDSEGLCTADLGNIVSYIPQTIFLNGNTIRNNVSFMTDDNAGDESKIVDCLKCAKIWDDIQKMPEGIDTLIGENGTTISGGQRQRIALARALYKDFEILIMDEATAALDMETEKAVIDSIRQIRKDKTLLMVTHHMSLADECEHVYKIENKNFVKIR